MHLGLDDVRGSILAALGLVSVCSVSACGPLVDAEDSTDDTRGDASAGDTSTSAGDETSDPPPVACNGSAPILQSDVAGSLPSGWEVCDDGKIHRVSLETCEVSVPMGPGCALEGPQGCLTDDECTAGGFGRCIQQSDPFGELDYCSCVYGCATDSDCGSGYVCACGGDHPDHPSRSQCIPSSCASDAACGDGSLCLLGSAEDGCSIGYAAACTTPQDSCAVDADCMGDEDCFPQDLGHWACESFCCCGRPLLVDGHPVTAPVEARDDWSSAALVGVDGLPAAVRRRIAEHYTQVGQLEHASVASFARFTLELMAVGAPPELLIAAQRAGLDEIDHALRCFTLASTYAGRSIGPGMLAVAGTSPATTLESMAAAVIDEACVGETLAAVEARAAARHATVPAVRHALEVIAADELRHATLGWATLRWVLGRADALLRARLLARLCAAIDAADRDRPPRATEAERARLRAHGVLDAADRRAAHAYAITQVLRPCAAALEASEAALAA